MASDKVTFEQVSIAFKENDKYFLGKVYKNVVSQRISDYHVINVINGTIREDLGAIREFNSSFSSS